MGRTNQGGSVLSFMIIGVVLAALLVGGAFGVRQLLKSSNNSGTSAGGGVAPAPVPDPQVSKDEQAKKAADAAKNKQAQDQKATQDAQNKAKTNGNAPAPVAPPTSAPTQPAPSSAGSVPVTAEKLPVTGPTETFMSILAVAALTASATAYAISRRKSAA